MDHHHEDKNTSNRLIDPVCGMAVTQASKFYEKLTVKRLLLQWKMQVKVWKWSFVYINEEGKSSPTKNQWIELK